MDALIADATLKMQIAAIRQRLDEAASIAKAAAACADADNLPKAVEIVLDIEQPIYEVSTLLNAASLIHRINKT